MFLPCTAQFCDGKFLDSWAPVDRVINRAKWNWRRGEGVGVEGGGLGVKEGRRRDIKHGKNRKDRMNQGRN